MGTLASWSICAALHYGIGGEFSTTPVFQISPVGLVQWHRGRYRDRPAGGRVTGATGGTGLTCGGGLRHGRRIFPLRVMLQTIALEKSSCRWGAHHAIAGKKNLFLMTSSFALSIVLVLCFSVLLKFAGLLFARSSSVAAGYSLERVRKRTGIVPQYGRTAACDSGCWVCLGRNRSYQHSCQQSAERGRACGAGFLR